MKDPDFATAYTELEPQMSLTRAIVNARLTQHLTQQELAKGQGSHRPKSAGLKTAPEIHP